MLDLNDKAIYELSKEFTFLAIQNGLIREKPAPEDTAKSVIAFYKTIFEALSNN
ncbi:hypothetical protein [Lachnotalea glycerini]|uniref:hypothetical protein n=1 Tax=Lachnotalea glycerini TaxID=1763509 RepID=UPI0015F2855B|nr:hypothetical protein [Lachnotalea glycerini]